MTNTIIARIRGLKDLTAADATQLYTGLAESTLGDKAKVAIRNAVGAKTCEGPDASRLAVSIKPQLLLDISNYPTHAQWDVMMDPGTSYLAKATTLTALLRSLGVQSLREQTAKSCIGLLVTVVSEQQKSMPEHRLIYQMLGDFKNVFASTPLPRQLPIIRVFPLTFPR